MKDNKISEAQKKIEKILPLTIGDYFNRIFSCDYSKVPEYDRDGIISSKNKIYNFRVLENLSFKVNTDSKKRFKKIHKWEDKIEYRLENSVESVIARMDMKSMDYNYSIVQLVDGRDCEACNNEIFIFDVTTDRENPKWDCISDPLKNAYKSYFTVESKICEGKTCKNILGAAVGIEMTGINTKDNMEEIADYQVKLIKTIAATWG